MLRVESPGRLVKRARVNAGLTQAQLAERLGVSQPQVSRWERGEDLPSPEQWPGLRQALGIDPAVFERVHLERGSVEALRDEVRAVRREMGDIRAQVASVTRMLQDLLDSLGGGSTDGR